MNNKRKKFSHVNKYQKSIFRITILPTIIVCLSVSLFLIFFFRHLIRVIAHNTPVFSVEFINQWATIGFFFLWTVVALMLLIAYEISKNLVGAFERIIRELDVIIEKKERKEIHVRNEDDLAKELVKRINILIKDQKD